MNTSPCQSSTLTCAGLAEVFEEYVADLLREFGGSPDRRPAVSGARAVASAVSTVRAPVLAAAGVAGGLADPEVSIRPGARSTG